MTWTAVLLVLIVSHAAGDVLLQTDRQATTKGGENAAGRRALLAHVAVYTLAFVPALVWIGEHAGVGRAILVGALIAVPHLMIDDGRLVALWLREVKGSSAPPLALVIATDQSVHLLCLFGAALVAVA